MLRIDKKQINRLDLLKTGLWIDQAERRLNQVNSELKSAEEYYHKCQEKYESAWFPEEHLSKFIEATVKYALLKQEANSLNNLLPLLKYHENKLKESVTEQKQNDVIHALSDKVARLEAEVRQLKTGAHQSFRLFKPQEIDISNNIDFAESRSPSPK